MIKGNLRTASTGSTDMESAFSPMRPVSGFSATVGRELRIRELSDEIAALKKGEGPGKEALGDDEAD